MLPTAVSLYTGHYRSDPLGQIRCPVDDQEHAYIPTAKYLAMEQMT